MKSEFIKLYESLSALNEAKQDTINFIKWIQTKGAYSEHEANSWAQRFDNIKQYLKAPENDYYYWIKKNDIDIFRRAVSNCEHNLETKKLDKAKVAEGAKLVSETEHWKMYHITNYEASRVYGRDSQWCITGINNYGDRWWKDYTRKGYNFYFITTKGEYDPRGDISKFAFAIHDGAECYKIFNQRDDEVDLEDIPYYEEIKIPGINLDYYTNGESFFCDDCGDVLSGDGDDTYCSPDGSYYYCSSCWDKHYFYCQNCGEAYSLDEVYIGADGYNYCYDCWCEYFTDCHSCGEVIEYSEAREGDDYNYYCEHCWENTFFICQECDEVYRKDNDLVETDDGEFCDGCYRDLYEEDEE